MGYVEYKTPDDLRRVWWKPFRAMGYSIGFYAVEPDRAEPMTVTPRMVHNIEDLSVEWDKPYVLGARLSHSLKAIEGSLSFTWTARPREAFCRVGSQARFPALTLIASGANSPSVHGDPVAPYDEFASIFVIPRQLVPHVRDLLCALRPGAHVDHLRPDSMQNTSTAPNEFKVSSLTVRSGACISVESGEIRDWLSIDVQPGVFQRRRTRELHQNLAMEIIQRGGSRVPIALA